MKKLMVMACIALASVNVANAWQRGGQNASPEQMTERMVEKLDKELKLTDEQEQKITALYEEFYRKHTSRSARQSNMAALNQKVSEVLNEEQKEAFQKINEQKKGRSSHHAPHTHR